MVAKKSLHPFTVSSILLLTIFSFCFPIDTRAQTFSDELYLVKGPYIARLIGWKKLEIHSAPAGKMGTRTTGGGSRGRAGEWAVLAFLRNYPELRREGGVLKFAVYAIRETPITESMEMLLPDGQRGILDKDFMISYELNQIAILREAAVQDVAETPQFIMAFLLKPHPMFPHVRRIGIFGNLTDAENINEITERVLQYLSDREIITKYF